MRSSNPHDASRRLLAGADCSVTRTRSFSCLAGCLLWVGCAREARPVLSVPFEPPVASHPSLPTRIPPSIEPYTWPEVALATQGPPSWVGDAGMPYALSVQRAAMYYQLPAELVWAVIKVESGFRSRAESPAGAQGLMQLMPATARSIGINDTLDPDQNILGGTYYLRYLANRFQGDLYLTLAAYNAGPGSVKRYGGVPPFPETHDFVRKVVSYYWSALRGTSDAEMAGVAPATAR